MTVTVLLCTLECVPPWWLMETPDSHKILLSRHWTTHWYQDQGRSPWQTTAGLLPCCYCPQCTTPRISFDSGLLLLPLIYVRTFYSLSSNFKGVLPMKSQIHLIWICSSLFLWPCTLSPKFSACHPAFQKLHRCMVSVLRTVISLCPFHSQCGSCPRSQWNQS